jgi:hypothetical protein
MSRAALGRNDEEEETMERDDELELEPAETDVDAGDDRRSCQGCFAWLDPDEGRELIGGWYCDDCADEADEEEDTMHHDVSPKPSNLKEENALDLAKTLRDAYQAWVSQIARDAEGEVWILTEVLLQGIFGFAAPTIVGTLNLDERGAETVAKEFSRALSSTIQRRRRATPEGA